MTWTLKQGDWRDELADIEEVDAIITDPPFGARPTRAMPQQRFNKSQQQVKASGDLLHIKTFTLLMFMSLFIRGNIATRDGGFALHRTI